MLCVAHWRALLAKIVEVSTPNPILCAVLRLGVLTEFRVGVNAWQYCCFVLRSCIHYCFLNLVGIKNNTYL